jgi:hypothetical protein
MTDAATSCTLAKIRTGDHAEIRMSRQNGRQQPGASHKSISSDIHQRSDRTVFDTVSVKPSSYFANMGISTKKSL